MCDMILVDRSCACSYDYGDLFVLDYDDSKPRKLNTSLDDTQSNIICGSLVKLIDHAYTEQQIKHDHLPQVQIVLGGVRDTTDCYNDGTWFTQWHLLRPIKIGDNHEQHTDK